MVNQKKLAAYEKKADEIIGQMSLEEKAAQLKYDAPSLKKLGIKSYNWWNEALHGAARTGVATVFPQSIGLAAAFDEKLLYDVGDIISTEVRAKYNQYQKKEDHEIYKGLTCWSPNVNIFRDPRWGRGHETYGEDPCLTSKLGVAFIKGMQGENEEFLKTAACAKHFAVHSGPESMRHGYNAQVSKKNLYETYLPAFEACVKEANVEAVMGAYNAVNDEPSCASEYLIKDVLRGKWGFKGHFVSDCGAISDIFANHKAADSVAGAAAMAVKAGCDLNCGQAYGYLLAAVNQGLLTENDLDICLKRLLITRLKLGTINQTTPWDDIPYTVNDCEEHHKVSLDAAKKSLVLLKNDGTLPLDKNKIKTIAVIGPNADSKAVLLGNYNGTPSSYETVLTGIRSGLPNARVLYSEGCHLYKDRVEACALPDDRLSEALIVAEHSDAVVLCIGLDSTLEGEEGDAFNADASGDKKDLLLPQSQIKLMNMLKGIDKPVIVVNMSGSSIDLSFVRDNFSAVIQAFYPGQYAGRAVSQLIFGEFSPSGRLPVTFYESTGALPSFDDYSMEDRTYRYTDKNIQYPFGFGLSYTKFEYSNIQLSFESIQRGETLTCSVLVKNTGDFDGDEIIEMYIKYNGVKADMPRYQLKGFKRVSLKKGEKQQASFEITPQMLETVNALGESAVESGSYTVFVGGSQPDEQSVSLSGSNTLSANLTVV